MTTVEMKSAVPGGNGNGADIGGSQDNPAKGHRLRNVTQGGEANKSRVMEWATVYAANGLNLVPVIPGKARTPAMTGFTTRRKSLSVAAVERKFSDCMVDHGGACIGLVTGKLSGVLVVDVDAPDPAALAAAVERFGNTPLVARTPGGWHLFFAHCDGAGNRQRLDVGGFPVDIRGEGGLAILAPSLHHRGSEYEWFRGDASMLWSGELPEPDGLDPANDDRPAHAPAIREGSRNGAILAAGRLFLPRCSTVEDLTARLIEYRDEHFGDLESAPYPDDDVRRQAAWIWDTWDARKAAKGADSAYVTVYATELAGLSPRDWGPLGFLCWLKSKHPARRPEGFAIDCAKVGDLIGVNEKTVKGWRAKLADSGLLVMVRKGSAGRGNGHRFEFAERSGGAAIKGPPKVHNVLPVNPPPHDRQGDNLKTTVGVRLDDLREGLGVDHGEFAGMVGAYLTARGVPWSADGLAAVIQGRAAQVEPSLLSELSAVADMLSGEIREAS